MSISRGRHGIMGIPRGGEGNQFFWEPNSEPPTPKLCNISPKSELPHQKMGSPNPKIELFCLDCSKFDTTTFNQNLGISHAWKIRFWPPVKLRGGGGHPTPFPLIWTLKTTHNTSIRGASAPLILIFTRRIWDSKIAEGDTSDHNRGRNAVSSSQKLGVENGSKNTH